VNAQERYDEIADDLAARNPEVELGQMMGMPAIKANGKMIGGFSRSEEAMVFKLTDPMERELALALTGAHLFDPSGRGRPMKEWVVVPQDHAERWPELARQALTRPAA
jgi:hypothetical protein